jgi:PAS domain S-box-containing protein
MPLFRRRVLIVRGLSEEPLLPADPSLVQNLRSIFRAIGDGIALLDGRGRVLEANGALTKVLGKPASELVGQPVSELLPGGPEVRDVFRDALQNRRRQSLTLESMHGGSVRARSEGAGKGTEFEVRLPVLAEAPAPNPIREDSMEKAERARLLLIEDNPDIGETLLDLREVLGHRVDLASDGLRGVQMALALRPDAALVDIGLPGIDGYEVAQRLRADPVGREMLLVALTGYGRPEDREKALEAGFDAHLVKPVDPEDLTSLIGELSARRRETGTAR